MHSLSTIITQEFRADLHCHTSCSDGSMSPIQIIDLAISSGLNALAITDHDTIDAYKTAIPYAKEKQFCLGTGVEFSCEFKNHSIHVLGYDFSLNSDRFLNYCAKQQEKRVQRNLEILRKLNLLKMNVLEEDLFVSEENVSSVGRPHIAAAMVRKGYVRSIQEAFQLYLGDNQSCFVSGTPFPVEEALSVIHEAGGKAFVAHPHLYRDASVIRNVLTLPFDGIECYYGRASLDRTKRWKKMARQKGLLMSGGSDFHGEAKPYISLGCSWIGKEVFSAIFEKNLI